MPLVQSFAIEIVTQSPHRTDNLLLRISLQFLSKAGDMNPHHIGGRLRLGRPDSIHQGLGGEVFIRMPGEELEQRIFDWGKLQIFASQSSSHIFGIKFEGTNHYHRISSQLRSPQDRSYPGGEFSNVIGLSDIVIGTTVETFFFLFNLGATGQKNYRCLAPEALYFLSTDSPVSSGKPISRMMTSYS